MSAVYLLQKIISEDAVVPLNQDRKSVDLSENETTFTIRNLPTDSIAIKADKFPAPIGFFKGNVGENRRADFIIISEASTEKRWVVYIEMKGEAKPDNKRIITQLKGAQCVIAYCRSVAEKFHGKTKFLDEKQYQSRFISIKSISVPKTPNTDSSARVHDCPRRMLKLKYQKRFQFSRLVGNQ